MKQSQPWTKKSRQPKTTVVVTDLPPSAFEGWTLASKKDVPDAVVQALTEIFTDEVRIELIMQAHRAPTGTSVFVMVGADYVVMVDTGARLFIVVTRAFADAQGFDASKAVSQ